MINEGLEKGDLARLVHTELHCDEFKSKLGSDKDVVVISFKVKGKEPGLDLVNFIEKGYDWVIDADVSSGEMDDGDYLVFIECERNTDVPEDVIAMMGDLMNLTDQDLSEWTVQYHKDPTKHALTLENLEQIIPTSSEAYMARFSNEEIDKLKTAAGVDVDTKAPKNDFTESLRIAAGIR